MNDATTKNMRLWLLSSAAALVFTGSAAAQSASPDPAPAAPGSAVSEVVVTGSRLSGRDYVSASPIATFDRQLLERTDGIAVDTLIQSLPQLGSNIGASGNNAADQGIVTANLHELGANRTLVLVDGRRVISGDSVGAVDLNIIPQSLLKSVEIITGGASAVYGSDAVAGVINFKLDDKFTGLKLSGFGETTDVADGGVVSFDGAYGWQSDTGRGGFAIYGSYARRAAILSQNRPDLSRQIGITFDANGNPIFADQVNNALKEGAFVPTASNLPSQAAVNNVFARYGVAAGTVTNSRVLGFNNDGSLFSNSPLVNYKGGQVSNPYYYSFNVDNYLQTPETRYTTGFLGSWRFSPQAEVYARLYFIGYHDDRAIAPYSLTTSLPVTNPFIPADLRSVLSSRPSPNAAFTFQRTLTELGDRSDDYDTTELEFLGGVRGQISGDWHYDVYVSHGRTDRSETAGGAFNVAALTRLVTASDGGASLCAGGLNLFGAGTISQSCVNYINANPHTETTAEETVVEGTVEGTLFKLPAGPVKVALGATYRSESYDVVGDPLYASGAVVGGLRPAASLSGSYDVKEVYGEVRVPLLADLPLVHRLDLTGGYRYSDYSQAGGVSSYKGELTYTIVPQLSLRSSYQRAVRAPNITELFLPSAVSNLVVTQDACSYNSAFRTGAVPGVDPASVRALCLAQGVPAASIDRFVGVTSLSNAVTTLGNTNLRPESADTITAGGVVRSPIRSGLFSRMSASLDYFRIDLSHTISQVAANDLFIRCYNQFGVNPQYSPNSQFCSAFTRDVNGNISSGVSTYLNVGSALISGLDAQLNWQIPLGQDGLPGVGLVNLQFDSSTLLTAKLQTLAGAPYSDLLGTIGATSTSTFPELKNSLWAQYVLGRFDVGVRWRHISALKAASLVTAPTVPALGTPDYDLIDFDSGVRINKQLSLRFGIVNAFDKKPPIESQPSGTNTDPATFDVIGRRLFLRLDARF